MKHENIRLLKDLRLKRDEEKRIGEVLLTQEEREIVKDPATYIFNKKFSIDLKRDKEFELILNIKIREKE